MQPLARPFRAVVCAALSLTALPVRLQSQSAPILVVVPPPGEAPATAEMGTLVAWFGRGFCPTGFTVSLTIRSDLIKPIVIGTVVVNGGGAFVTKFTVSVPFAWRYLITAEQTGSGGTLTTELICRGRKRPIIGP